MQKKNHDGYISYSYLEAGKDYKAFALAQEIGRVEPYTYPVSDEEEARVKRIFAENIVISLHDHTFVAPKNLAEFFEFRRQGRDWTGYEGLAASGLDAVFDAMMDGTAMITSKSGWKWDDVITDIGLRLSDIAHQDLVKLALTTRDIEQCKKNGQIAFVVSLESSTMIENELDRIDILYGIGVRSMGIAYSEGNSLGAGLREEGDGGLTQFGRQAVERMNKLGVAIDISHSGDKTGLDTIQTSDKPVFITHAGARTLWNSRRLKNDETLQACAAKGGVIGIEAAPHTTLTDKNRTHSLEPYMEHVEYVANLVGIDHVALGPDVLFGDHVGLHHLLAGPLSIGAAHKGNEFEEVAYVEGLENPAEAFPNIVRWLVKHGYSDADIGKVVGGNIMRALKEVWWK